MNLFCFKMTSVEETGAQASKLGDLEVSTFEHDDCACLAVKHSGSLVELTTALGRSYQHDRFAVPEDELEDSPQAIYAAYQERLALGEQG